MTDRYAGTKTDGFEDVRQSWRMPQPDRPNICHLDHFPSTPSTPTPDTSHHPGFMSAVSEIVDMHARKMADYGKTDDPFSNVRASEDFGIPGWVGAIVRGNDKMRRLQKAAQGAELVNESIEDSLLDLAVYSLIGLVLFREVNQ